MKRISKAASRWWVYWPGLIILLAAWLMPASLWFDTRSLSVSDTMRGIPATVVEDRAIRLSFHGEYNATARDAVTGEIASGCAGSGKVHYRGGLSGTRSWSLVDFIDGRQACRELPAGRYFVEVCRTVERPFLGILPSKTICTTSNVFSVRDPALERLIEQIQQGDNPQEPEIPPALLPYLQTPSK